MFNKSLDSKSTYIDEDGQEVVDLTESIFDPAKGMSKIGDVYRVSKDLEMRPDLMSKSLYGSTNYTEMLIKYSLINNPFAIEKDDLIYGISLSGIYAPIKENMVDNTGSYEAVKRYHKYIDKKKVPDQPGSDKNETKILPTEANISKTGNNGVTVRNGKVYFGSIDDSLTTTDSSIVDCATDGTTLGEFLNATLRNG